jgi:hypothetical protein
MGGDVTGTPPRLDDWAFWLAGFNVDLHGRLLGPARLLRRVGFLVVVRLLWGCGTSGADGLLSDSVVVFIHKIQARIGRVA